MTAKNTYIYSDSLTIEVDSLTMEVDSLTMKWKPPCW